MTKNANGNEATALMNAALGNVLGIFVSPALVSTFETPLYNATPEDESQNTAGGHVDFVSVLKQLGITVLAPLVVGQIIQWIAPEKVAKFKVKFRLSDVSNVALLFMVWSVFSDAVHSGSFSTMTAKDFVAIAIMNAGFYVLFSFLCFFLAYLPLPALGRRTPRWIERMRYSREDTVAVMYCGATKTVAMGVPLINVLYQNGDPGTIGVLSTPLLLYHVEQLIIGNFEVEILRRWVQNGKKQESTTSSKGDPDEAFVPQRDEEDQIMEYSATRIDSPAGSGYKGSNLDGHKLDSTTCPHGSTMVVAPGSSTPHDSCPECYAHSKAIERP